MGTVQASAAVPVMATMRRMRSASVRWTCRGRWASGRRRARVAWSSSRSRQDPRGKSVTPPPSRARRVASGRRVHHATAPDGAPAVPDGLSRLRNSAPTAFPQVLDQPGQPPWEEDEHDEDPDVDGNSCQLGGR